MNSPSLPSEPRPGDILLFYRARRMNRLITWFSGSQYYHVAIYAGDHSIIEARIYGVVHSDLRTRRGGHEFVVIPAPQDRGQAALDWARKQLGYGYAFGSVLAIMLERVFQRLELNVTQPQQFSCGELIAEAFSEAGVRLFPDQDLEDVAPWHFARLLE